MKPKTWLEKSKVLQQKGLETLWSYNSLAAYAELMQD